MNLRDLNWVRQLMLEKHLLERSDETSGLPLEDIQWQLLEDVRSVIRRAEVAVVYLKQWSNLMGLKADFDWVEICRRRALTRTHPCNLIRPYLVISGPCEDN
jgi:hypothetical protein